MRLTTGNQLYEGFEQIMESTHECPVDTEYSLPDYCADIRRSSSASSRRRSFPLP